MKKKGKGNLKKFISELIGKSKKVDPISSERYSLNLDYTSKSVTSDYKANFIVEPNSKVFVIKLCKIVDWCEDLDDLRCCINGKEINHLEDNSTKNNEYGIVRKIIHKNFENVDNQHHSISVYKSCKVDFIKKRGSKYLYEWSSLHIISQSSNLRLRIKMNPSILKPFLEISEQTDDEDNFTLSTEVPIKEKIEVDENIIDWEYTTQPGKRYKLICSFYSNSKL